MANPLHNINTDEREQDQWHGNLREHIVSDVVIYLDLKEQPKERQTGEGELILEKKNPFS